MVTVQEVNPQEFINRLKEELKKIENIKEPSWMKFAKSGSHKERPPEQKDFWYIRAASILRRLYIDGPIGVERLRTYYGGRKSRGTKPSKFRKASGNIIRKILQQLEGARLVEKAGKSGRKLTSNGRRLLDRIAYEVKKSE
jgi:small subunit ribosomal protein S19e